MLLLGSISTVTAEHPLEHICLKTAFGFVMPIFPIKQTRLFFPSVWLWRPNKIQLWLHLIQTPKTRVNLEHTHKQGSYQSVPQPAWEKRSKPEEFSSILLSSGSFFLGTLLGCWAWRGFSSGAILLGWGMISWVNGWGGQSLEGLKVCQKKYGWNWGFKKNFCVGVF